MVVQQAIKQKVLEQLQLQGYGLKELHENSHTNCKPAKPQLDKSSAVTALASESTQGVGLSKLGAGHYSITFVVSAHIMPEGKSN